MGAGAARSAWPSANADGIVALGGDLEPDTLLAAYRAGYANFSRERSDIRAALPEVVARVAGLRAALAPKVTSPARRKAARDAPEPERDDEGAPPMEPMMTEEEWVAAFAPKPRAEAGAAP